MPAIIVGMTDYDVMKRVATLFDVTLIGPIQRKGNRKPYWRVNFAGKRAAEWSMTLYTLLGTRRQAAIREILTEWRLKPARSRTSRKGFMEKQNAIRCANVSNAS